jgi:predicted dehydrogenase
MAIKVVVTGLGARGHDWIKAVNSSPLFEVVGCVDTSSTARDTITKTQGIASSNCYVDLDTALNDSKDCQAVIVVTPAPQHYNDCEIALMHDKAVLVEKPFTTNLADAAKLVSLAETRRVPLMVAQNYRHLRVYRTVRNVIREGRLGRVGMVVCHYYRVPHQMSEAQLNATQSVLWGMGVHHFDVLRYVLDSAVNNVMADDFTLAWTKLPKGASLRTMLTFDNGTRAYYTATYESSGHEFFERGQEFYGRFVGELATLHIFQRWLILCEKGKLPRLIRRGARTQSEEQTLLGEFEKAVLKNEQGNSSGRDNLQTMAILEACLRSSSEKKWINPQELLDELD